MSEDEKENFSNNQRNSLLCGKELNMDSDQDLEDLSENLL